MTGEIFHLFFGGESLARTDDFTRWEFKPTDPVDGQVLASQIANRLSGGGRLPEVALSRIMNPGMGTCRLLEEAVMPAKKLSEAEIALMLPKVKGWSVANGKLHREFACKDFLTAFGNMIRVALVAEKMDHHPEWFNMWNKVVIDLTTHSVKGISDYDFNLAEKINQIFGE